jgi:hypothetical protein
VAIRNDESVRTNDKPDPSAVVGFSPFPGALFAPESKRRIIPSTPSLPVAALARSAARFPAPTLNSSTSTVTTLGAARRTSAAYPEGSPPPAANVEEAANATRTGIENSGPKPARHLEVNMSLFRFCMIQASKADGPSLV